MSVAAIAEKFLGIEVRPLVPEMEHGHDGHVVICCGDDRTADETVESHRDQHGCSPIRFALPGASVCFQDEHGRAYILGLLCALAQVGEVRHITIYEHEGCLVYRLRYFQHSADQLVIQQCENMVFAKDLLLEVLADYGLSKVDLVFTPWAG